MNLKAYRVPAWETESELKHGFLGRVGGNSQGAYAGLNASFAVGDETRAVNDNYCDMKRAMGMAGTRMVTMQQKHGDNIIDVTESCKNAGEGDAMITSTPGVFLAVLTADCLPIICWARTPRGNLAAVIHAGWRGTLNGVAIKTVQRIHSGHGTNAQDLHCALGPAIGPCCYEIGTDVSDPLLQKWGEKAEPSLKVQRGRTYLDLRMLNVALLAEAGVPVTQIASTGPCTACNPTEFFSYRRESQKGNIVTGRQASFIGWTEMV